MPIPLNHSPLSPGPLGTCLLGMILGSMQALIEIRLNLQKVPLILGQGHQGVSGPWQDGWFVWVMMKSVPVTRSLPLEFTAPQPLNPWTWSQEHRCDLLNYPRNLSLHHIWFDHSIHLWPVRRCCEALKKTSKVPFQRASSLTSQILSIVLTAARYSESQTSIRDSRLWQEGNIYIYIYLYKNVFQHIYSRPIGGWTTRCLFHSSLTQTAVEFSFDLPVECLKHYEIGLRAHGNYWDTIESRQAGERCMYIGVSS